MSYKDTLTLYEELVASGVSDAQAKVQAHQLGAIADYLGDAINCMNSTIAETNSRLDNTIAGVCTRLDKLDKDMWWMRAIGAGMIVTFFSNGFFMWLAK